jgi:hypothetical protein
VNAADVGVESPLHRLAPRAVGGQTAQQVGHRHAGTVLRQQARGAQPAAAIAGEVEDGQAGCDLAQEDNPLGMG